MNLDFSSGQVQLDPKNSSGQYWGRKSLASEASDAPYPARAAHPAGASPLPAAPLPAAPPPAPRRPRVACKKPGWEQPNPA